MSGKISINNTGRYVIIALLSFLNAISMQYVSSLSRDPGGYAGTQIYSFMPESLLWFGLCFFLLNRFFVKELWKKKGKLIFSLIFGLVLGFATVWSQELLYNKSLFDSPQRTVTALFVTVGIMIFTVPLTAVILGLCDSVSTAVLSQEPGKLKPVFYFLILWAVFFLSFLPLFLYTYPINLFGDATDALVGDYLQGARSTHHTPIHWLILGKFYDFGVSHGSANLGMSLFVVTQMLILSAALAFLSYYLYKKNVRRGIRIAVFLVSLLNPVNAYFAVTAEKGTIGMALVLVGIVILCMLYDAPFEGKGKTGIGAGNIVKMLLFVLTVSAGSLFRNNMIYAVAVAGVVIALLAGGKKKKCALLLMFALTLMMYKAEYTGLVKTQHLITDDKYRETFPLPIMCLSRIAVLHGEEMPKDL
ncbi:MAG: hypothetical protein ILP13_08360, partial [Lachnospiraceae bacterium]|nr:hypothetical protein [Lachnospiraceae bacterium]